MSTSFCPSAINGFLLVLKNAATFTITSGLGSIFIYLGKISITIMNSCVAYAILVTWPSLKKEINSPVFPLIAIFILSYLIASLFMSIFGVAATTLLQCFLTDVELSRKANKGDEGTHRPKELEHIVNVLKK